MEPAPTGGLSAPSDIPPAPIENAVAAEVVRTRPRSAEKSDQPDPEELFGSQPVPIAPIAPIGSAGSVPNVETAGVSPIASSPMMTQPSNGYFSDEGSPPTSDLYGNSGPFAVGSQVAPDGHSAGGQPNPIGPFAPVGDGAGAGAGAGTSNGKSTEPGHDGSQDHGSHNGSATRPDAQRSGDHPPPPTGRPVAIQPSPPTEPVQV